MIKQYIILGTLLSVLFASCSKTDNVAVDYPYILDEEFQNNDKGWTVQDTSATNQKYFMKLFTEGNGYFTTVYFSLFGAPTAFSHVNAGLNNSKNYIIETNMTFDNESYESSISNSEENACGVAWDVVDDNNFFKVGSGYNATEGIFKLFVEKAVNGAISEVVAPIVIDTKSPVANLKIEKTTQENNYNTIDIWFNGENVATIDSLQFNNGSRVGIHSEKGGCVNYHMLRVRQEP